MSENKETSAERLLRLRKARDMSEASLADPGVMRGLAEIRKAAQKQIEMSLPAAKEVREFAYTTLVVVRGVQESLQRHIIRHKQEEMRQARENDPKRPTRGVRL